MTRLCQTLALLALGLWLAVQPVLAQETLEEKVKPVSDFLQSLEGQWKGTATTFLGPEGGNTDDPWDVSFRLLQGGSNVLQEHAIEVKGAPHQGWALIGVDGDGGYSMALADSFHTGGIGLLNSVGRVDETGQLSVLGHYQAGGEQWSWRTNMSVKGDSLTIRAFNIFPDGTEYPAIEAHLTRTR